MKHPSYGGRYKSPPSVDVEGTWEGAVLHAAPLLQREVQKSPQCRCSIVMKALGRVKSGMQHPSYGGRYKCPCFHSDEGTWEDELEGEDTWIPLLWRGV